MSDSITTRKYVVAAFMVVGLLSFEIFNFDTTRYALRDLIGPVSIFSFEWASLMSIAFCSIDFAGLIGLFAPNKEKGEPGAIWYLMGAWLLGATMNAMMTWWAVSISLINSEFTEGVLTHAQVIKYVPIMVATIVWLSRILMIGSFSMVGEYLWESKDSGEKKREERKIPAAAPSHPRTRNHLPSSMPAVPEHNQDSPGGSLGPPQGQPLRNRRNRNA